MLLTITLWRLLAHPPSGHPLFRRAAAPRPPSAMSQVFRTLIAPITPALVLLGAGLVCCAVVSRSSGLYVPSAIALIFLFNGTWHGVRWSSSIAAQLAHERECQEWELLSLLPTGGLGSAWALAAGCAHRNNVLRVAYARQVLMLRVLVVIVAGVGVGVLLNVALSAQSRSTIMLYLFAVLAAFAPYLDFVQSSALAALTGILGGLLARRPLDAQVAAAGMFLAIQLGCYALFALVGFSALPQINEPLTWSEALVEVIMLLLRLVLFGGLREVALWVLWQVVSHRLNATTRQLAVLAAVPPMSHARP